MNDSSYIRFMKFRRILNLLFRTDARSRNFMEGWHEGIHYARTGHSNHFADQCPDLIKALDGEQE